MSPSKISSPRAPRARVGPAAFAAGRSAPQTVVDWGGGSAASQGFAEVIFPPFVLDGGTSQASRPDHRRRRRCKRRVSSAAPRRTGALDLYDWWDRARRGQVPRRRVVTVHLLGADQRSVVMTWRFRNARPVSLAYSPLLAMDAGVLMETIVIAFDGVEMV
jgi:hypothetical protein